jgi:hypothetical protein
LDCDDLQVAVLSQIDAAGGYLVGRRQESASYLREYSSSGSPAVYVRESFVGEGQYVFGLEEIPLMSKSHVELIARGSGSSDLSEAPPTYPFAVGLDGETVIIQEHGDGKPGTFVVGRT